ncbi:hypothetical protein AB3X55_03260 [Alphaproteobacteria bacterium LSUCC0719]
MTHAGQENYEDFELTTDQWSQVIEKARAAPQSDLHLYILRSLANQQVVTSASINAFKGRVVETAEDRKIASTAIGNISAWVREVTKPKATFYQWNEIRGEWTIGHFQRESLRQALGGNPCPDGGRPV